MRGKLIVIDGVGGAGKTTQIKLLKKALGKKLIVTHEPGGAPYAEEIRRMLLKGYGSKPDPVMDFFLFWAARVEHIRELVAPALKKGMTVISDRFDSSTYAFQIYGEECKELEPLFWEVRKVVLKNALPDAYILLDLPSDEAAKRRAGRAPTIDRFDERDVRFQKHIRYGFKAFAKKLGRRVHVIDSSRSAAEVHADILRAVKGVTNGYPTRN